MVMTDQFKNKNLFSICVDGSQYKIFLPNAGRDYIQTKIATQLEPYELSMLRDMKSRLEKGDLVVDVGANIGNHALYLSNIANCDVMAFEPNNDLCSAFQNSISHNENEKKITIFPYGLGAETSRAFFAKYLPENIGAQRLELGKGSLSVHPLDDVGIERKVKLIKIDVEGMELAVLRGAVKIINRDSPLIYVESQTESEFKLLQEFLSEVDYIYWDTFNATPTHLFLPKEKLDSDDFEYTHLKSAMKSYGLARIKTKYQTLQGRYSERQKLQERLLEGYAAAKKLSSEIESANLSINDLQNWLRIANKKNKTLESEYRKLKVEYEELKDSRWLAEKKRSGHYSKLIYYRRELLTIKSSKPYRSFQLLKNSRSFKNLLFLMPRLYKIIFIAEPIDSDISSIQSKQGGLSLNSSDNTSIEAGEKNDQKIQDEFFPLTPLMRQAGLIAWPEILPEKRNLPRVMSITDEFTTDCFKSDVALIQPRPDNWQSLFDSQNPDLIFIESAWKGNYGSWQFRVANYSNKPGNELNQLNDYCRYRSKPTVFWNKEDPVHHDKFMDAACSADYIFTTDANMIPSYKEKTGNNNVYALPFAAQPKLHYPAPLEGRIKKVCFAGSWYGNRHQTRGEDMQWLLNAALPLGIEIFDRNFGSESFNFPDNYHPFIRGGLPYAKLCEEYRRYRLFLNVNSVTDSPTMFSRRVFELLACGTPVVSTYASGIQQIFGDDIVWMVKNEKEAKIAIDTLLNDDDEWFRRSQAGIRAVFSNHTYSHRFRQVYDTCQIQWPIDGTEKIGVIIKIYDESTLRKAINFIESQSLEKFQIIFIKPEHLDLSHITLKNLSVLNDNQDLLDWLQASTITLISNIDVSTNYDEHYLKDLHNASIYADKSDVWARDYHKNGNTNADKGSAHLQASLIRRNLYCEIAKKEDGIHIADGGIYYEQGDRISLSSHSNDIIVRNSNPGEKSLLDVSISH